MIHDGARVSEVAITDFGGFDPATADGREALLGLERVLGRGMFDRMLAAQLKTYRQIGEKVNEIQPLIGFVERAA